MPSANEDLERLMVGGLAEACYRHKRLAQCSDSTDVTFSCRFGAVEAGGMGRGFRMPWARAAPAVGRESRCLRVTAGWGVVPIM